MTDKKRPEAMAAGHFEDKRDLVARWYMVNKDGMATLCTDRADAEREAADAQIVWPHMGPHRAVQLVEAASVAASAGSEPVAQAKGVFEFWWADHMPNATQAEAWREWCEVMRPGPIAFTHPSPPEGMVAGGSLDHLKLMMEHSAFAGALQLDDALANIDEFACASLSANAVAQTPAHIKAMERAWLWMENQADSQSKGGHATFDLMMLREERDALRAAIDAAPTAQTADSVLEDAARYRWLRQEHERVDPVCHLTWKRNLQRDSSEWVNTAVLDTAIDAARKQGANHD